MRLRARTYSNVECTLGEKMPATITKAVLKTVLTTGAFAAVHSALASRAAKRAASDAFGPANADGLYRVIYIAQSFAAAGLLVAYLKRLPLVELYRVRGRAAMLMHAAQVAGLLHATAGARQVGILRITGVENLAAWLKGLSVPPMPEAQGPSFSEGATDRLSGPFALSRHPLNLSPIPVLWLSPRMNSTLLAFNAAATVYLLIGSMHEEQRLLETEGANYEEYQASGVNFYLPSPNRNPLDSVPDLSA